MARRGNACWGVTLALVLLAPSPVRATFHIANISELLTSWSGSDSVQFVEIRMLTVGQQFVANSRLAVFDTAGNFVATVLTVPSNVQGGAGRPWIMASTSFEAAFGLTPDFTFPDGSLPTSGGMVCWGKPLNQAVPGQYVDCVAYGTYAGPSNVHIGTPTPLTAEGHSLRRVSDTNNNIDDFVCADPVEPENNAPASVSMPATDPCPVCGNDVQEPSEECDGTDDAACPGACTAQCKCAICGDDLVNAPGEECDGVDDSACPGDCLLDCTCAVCGDGVVEAPAEQCEASDDAACPGQCTPPGEPGECRCPPGPLDHFLCYKTKAKRPIVVSLSDAFDAGSYESKGIKFFCTPADKNGEGISDEATHLTGSKIKGPHTKRTGERVVNQFGEFFFDTKKADLLLMPATKSLFPNPQPPPVSPDSVVDHYRCLKVKPTKGTAGLPKGTAATVADQFGVRQVTLKKPRTLCIATDKNGEGIHRPEQGLVCYKIKPLVKHKPTDVWMRDQFEAQLSDLKGEKELCVPFDSSATTTTTTTTTTTM